LPSSQGSTSGAGMKLPEVVTTWRGNLFVTNVVARVGALVSLGLATVIVARVGGPTGVGIYALLRVLPSLAGVVASGGLPGAVTYFLSGPSRGDPRLRTTIIAIASVGGIAGTVAWILGAPLLVRFLFRAVPADLVMWAGVTVFTQLLVATVKSCSQGSDDLPGANRVIVLEELTFLPAYLAMLGAGVRGYAAIVAGLLIADVTTAALGWRRLAVRGFLRGAVAPAMDLVREIAAYGIRAQIGGVLLLLNLRFDFAILSALAGPAVLGTYAVASKFAELLRLPTMALTYVLYPRYARDGFEVAARKARALIPRAAVLVAVAALPLGVAAAVLLPVVYGEAFRASIVPTYILLFGLAGEGVAGVISAFLYGVGRPGLNSWAMGAGVIVTVVLDLVLIPGLGAAGAAIASSAAYLMTTCLLMVFFWMVRSRESRREVAPTPVGSSS
jgi:O-antigen/teichoic acid export membrane protein